MTGINNCKHYNFIACIKIKHLVITSFFSHDCKTIIHQLKSDNNQHPIVCRQQCILFPQILKTWKQTQCTINWYESKACILWTLCSIVYWLDLHMKTSYMHEKESKSVLFRLWTLHSQPKNISVLRTFLFGCVLFNVETNWNISKNEKKKI